MSAPQGKKISLAGLEPHAAVEKGKKLLWKYEETRYFVSFLWSYLFSFSVDKIYNNIMYTYFPSNIISIYNNTNLFWKDQLIWKITGTWNS